MKNYVILGWLCAAVTLGAPLASAQGFQVAPAQGGNAQTDQTASQQGQAMQQQILDQLTQQFQNLTPEQRQQMLEQATQQIHNMTPEQRAQLMDAAREQVQSITPQQMEEAKQRYDAMSEDQKQAAQSKVEQWLDKYPPEQRQQIINSWTGGPPPQQQAQPEQEQQGQEQQAPAQ